MRGDDAPLPGMIGRHPLMRDVYRLVRRAAPSQLAVLTEGETGTGKELVARALHAMGRGEDTPFIDMNCAAIAEDRVEAELFGWEEGAFTGAVAAKPGLLELANGGTAYLDEACSLTTPVQAKLLRAIERKEVRRLGGQQLIRVEFRVVCSISEPLEALLAAGRMRRDFAYRVAQIRVALPPLRERGADVRLLAETFLQRARNGEGPVMLAAEALGALSRHNWPGNVRELEALIERLVILAEGPVITAAMVDAELPRPRVVDPASVDILHALEANAWNVSKTARQLGMHRTTLHLKLKHLGLTRPGRYQVPVSNSTLHL